MSSPPIGYDAFALLTAQRSHTSGPLAELVPWFTKQENLENEVRLREDPDHRNPALEAIREALTRFLSALPHADYKNPRISRLGVHGQANPEGSLVFEKNGQPLAIQQLSDGEQVLLLTVMEQARRLVEAWPDADNPIDQQGILLIDEVALHLHPSWQRAALPALRETFPGVQIIATTHSPQVMASVPTASIQVLDNFQLHKAPVPVYGRDSNAILEELLEVPERPQAIKEALDRVSQHIDDEDLAAAQQALDKLKEQLSSQDGEVVRLQTVLDFLAS
ncbi:MAG: AAA family ATPase [Myxococcota bacterium]|nr:AAA family ATPase [Myxococcota bacterium]